MKIPQDIPAEASILGTVFLRGPVFMGQLSSQIEPSDFYDKDHAALFSACIALHEGGSPCDPELVVRRALGTNEVGGKVATAIAVAVSVDTAMKLAEHVVELSARRKAMAVATELMNRLESGEDLSEIVDGVSADLARVNTVAKPVEMERLEDFASRADSNTEWVIPDFLHRRGRMILVAAAGVGKATLIRQMCWGVSRGLHPFTLKLIPPLPTLLVDVENPSDAINEIARPMIRYTEKCNLPATADCRILHQEQGMDLRSRVDRNLLESALSEHRPALVGIGPLYKLYHRKGEETAEEAALAILRIFDDLRVRYDCAFIIEHHSPRGESLLPFGSSAFERWPELGVTLMSTGDPTMIEMGRFRGDRIKVKSPTHLHISGSGWPFEGVWDSNPR